MDELVEAGLVDPPPLLQAAIPSVTPEHEIINFEIKPKFFFLVRFNGNFNIILSYLFLYCILNLDNNLPLNSVLTRHTQWLHPMKLSNDGAFSDQIMVAKSSASSTGH